MTGNYADRTLRQMRDRRLAVWTELKRMIDSGKFSGSYYDALQDELQVLDASIASVLKVVAAAADCNSPTFASGAPVSSGTAITGTNQVAYWQGAPAEFFRWQYDIPKQKPDPPHEPADPVFTDITGIDPPDTYDGWRDAYVRTGLQSALDHMREHVR